MDKTPEFPNFLEPEVPGYDWRRRLMGVALVGAFLLSINGEEPNSQPSSAQIEALAIPDRNVITDYIAEGLVRDDATAEDSEQAVEPAPEATPPAEPASGRPEPPPPLAVRANDGSTNLDRSGDIEINGELLPLSQAQTDIINSLDIPAPDKEQITTLMRGAMTLWAHGVPINAEGMVAQGILESGRQSNWTENSLANYHNFFGMKGRPDDPPETKRVFNSAEYENGGMTAPQPFEFLIFPNPTEGIEGYAEFIMRRWWYRDALEDPAAISDPRVYFDHFVNGNLIWTPTPTYTDDLIAMVSELRLTDIVAAR